MRDIILILFIHWIADFVLQTDRQAKEKSKSFAMLFSHTLTYTSCWLIPALYWSVSYNKNFVIFGRSFLLFIFVTFVCHTITDYFTSRLNTKLWKKGDIHLFFMSVGFDQFLHYTQLFLTFFLCLER